MSLPTFLAPWYIPVVAAMAAIPPLVLLYFLKLKRREVPIASTLLWRKAVEDLQVNSPFQRLRNNLLLILQILAILAAVLAIAEPMLTGKRGVEKALVLMIDHSASMAANEDGQTRLELAKKAATRVVNDMTPAQRAMVIAFADRARVLTPFTDDRDALRRAIDSVKQSDAPGRLTEAMGLAQAHSTPVGEVGREVEIADSQYMLFTDGRLADAAQTVVQRGVLEVVRTGTSTDNVGIVNLDVRRHYETPEQISVMARVRNFGTSAVTRDVSLYVNDQLKDVRPVKLAPLGDAKLVSQQALTTAAPAESESTISFELAMDTAAQVEVRLSGSDALPTDDRAFALATAPRPVSILLVTPGNRFLKRAVASMDLGSSEVWSPDDYEKKAKTDLVRDGKCRFDVVILDGHSTEQLPPGNYIFFDCTPIIDGVQTGGRIKGQVFLDWDESHPILRHVVVQNMFFFSWLDLKMPPEATTLIAGKSGPVVSLLSRERRQYLICAFGLFNEDRTLLNTPAGARPWPYDPGFIVFLQNAVRYLAGASSSGQVPPVRPGEAFELPVRPGPIEAKVIRPDNTTDKVKVLANNTVDYGRTDRVGIYQLSPGVEGDNARAVNLLDDTESWVAPNEQFQIAGGTVVNRAGTDRVNRPLWPYLLGAMGVILLIEWLVYNKRVFV